MEETITENQEVQTEPKKKGKLGLILAIAIPVLVVAIVIGIFAGISANKTKQYKQAIALLDDGDIAEAVAIHEKLGDYKDLKLQICDAAEDEFEDKLNDRSYKKAMKIYSAVVDYPDAIEALDELLQEHVQRLVNSDEMSSIEDLYNRAVKDEVAVEQLSLAIAESAASWLAEYDYYNVIQAYKLLAEQENAIAKLEDQITLRYTELLENSSYEAEDLREYLKDYGVQVEGILAAMYEKACALLDSAEYYQARTMFEELGEYLDSATKLGETNLGIALTELQDYLDNQNWYSAEYYIGRQDESLQEALIELYLTYCGDGTFIADLEAAVAARMALEAQGAGYQEILDAEMAILKKYENLPFYDERLEELANNYLDVLDNQEWYANWYSGSDQIYYWGLRNADRYAVLTLLNEEYGYAANNAELQKVLGTTDATKTYWEAWKNIYYDLDNDIYWDICWTWGDTILDYANETEYTFSAHIVTTCTDGEGNTVSTQEYDITNIAPGEQVVLAEDISDLWSYNYSYTIEITSIYSGETCLDLQ